jgi:hypothetical protein
MIIFNAIVRAIRHLVCNDPPAPAPVKPFPTEAEIDAALRKLAEQRGQKGLDWKNSITDLLVVLEIPNMFHTRGGLYNDLGGEGEYKGTAEQNVWMIHEVRNRFAAGKID